MLTKNAQKAPSTFYYINQTINANIINNNKLVVSSIICDVDKMLTKKLTSNVKFRRSIHKIDRN